MEEEKVSVLPDEVDKKEEISYGKFNSAEELLKAYSALESEFTKRSQRLRELEAQSTQSAKEKEIESFVQRFPVVERFADEFSAELAGTAGAEQEMERALINVLSRKVKTADEMAQDEGVIRRVLGEEENREIVINGYLDRIRENEIPPVLTKGGAIPVTPTYRAKSIHEAGEIAKKILERI